MDTDVQRKVDQNIHSDYKEVSNLAKYPFENYWPQKSLKVCVTGAGGFIASHLAKRLKSEGHYVVACDWKRNEHFSVSSRGGVADSNVAPAVGRIPHRVHRCCGQRCGQ
jgi:hypothetical protein